MLRNLFASTLLCGLIVLTVVACGDDDSAHIQVDTAPLAMMIGGIGVDVR